MIAEIADISRLAEPTHPSAPKSPRPPNPKSETRNPESPPNPAALEAYLNPHLSFLDAADSANLSPDQLRQWSNDNAQLLDDLEAAILRRNRFLAAANLQKAIATCLDTLDGQSHAETHIPLGRDLQSIELRRRTRETALRAARTLTRLAGPLASPFYSQRQPVRTRTGATPRPPSPRFSGERCPRLCEDGEGRARVRTRFPTPPIQNPKSAIQNLPSPYSPPMSQLAFSRFADLLSAIAAKTPTPGGGAVASAVGALSAALAEMVVAYSVGKKSLAPHAPALTAARDKLENARALLLQLADEDAAAYGAVNELSRLPETDPKRTAELPAAIAASVQVPAAVMAACSDLLRLMEDLAPITNKQLKSDLAIAAILAEATARASRWNILVNAPSLPTPAARDAALTTADQSAEDAQSRARRIERACM